MNTAQHFFGSYFVFYHFINLSFTSLQLSNCHNCQIPQPSESSCATEDMTLWMLQRKQKENYISELTQGVADGMLYLKYENYAA